MSYRDRRGDGYRLGDLAYADLLHSVELGRELQRRPRQDRARRAVLERTRTEFGCLDLGGEG